MDAIFTGPKLKVKRANNHIHQLNELLNAFVKTDFCRLHVEEHKDTGDYVLKFEMTKPIPEEVPLTIGDAIHNLRSALDLMACEIVSLSGGTPSKWTNFPFRDTRQELEATLNGGEIKIAGADIITLIVDIIKPYKGGNDSLCALHSLDIADKHRLLLPVFSVAALTDVNGKAGGVTFTNCTFAAGESGILNVLGMPGKFEFQGYGKPAISISFDKAQPLEGQPVIPTLQQLAQIVLGVIQTVEKAFLARRKGTA
jgi:hypothetical protein